MIRHAWELPRTVEEAWYTQAECSGMSPASFYSPTGEGWSSRLRRERLAKEVCHRCPVRRACVVEALAADEQHGVWGGLTPLERADLAALVSALEAGDGWVLRGLAPANYLLLVLGLGQGGELTDREWELLDTAFPLPSRPGGRRVNRRRMLDAILHRARAGGRWSDLPTRYGRWKTANDCNRLWLGDGTWAAILDRACEGVHVKLVAVNRNPASLFGSTDFDS